MKEVLELAHHISNLQQTQIYLSNQYSATRDSIIIPSLLKPYFGERLGFFKNPGIIEEVWKLIKIEKEAAKWKAEEEKRNKQAKRPMTPPPTLPTAPKEGFQRYI